MDFKTILLSFTVFLKIISLGILFFDVLPAVWRELRKQDMIFSIRIGLFIFIADYVISIILSLIEDIFHFTLPNHPIQIIMIIFIRGITFFIGTLVLHYIYHLHITNEDLSSKK